GRFTVSADQPSLLADGAGWVMVTWHAGALPDYTHRTFVQRLSGSGVAQWGPAGQGKVLSVDNWGSGQPHILTDGVGGAIVEWEALIYHGGPAGDRSSYSLDIYAQHVTAAGIAQWPNANLIATNAEEENAASVSDGKQGLTIAY